MMYRNSRLPRARRASLNWQGSGLEIHRAARPLGVRIPRPPPLLKHLGEPTFGARIVMDDHRKVRPDSLSGTALKLWGATRFPVRGSRSRFPFESRVVG